MAGVVRKEKGIAERLWEVSWAIPLLHSQLATVNTALSSASLAIGKNVPIIETRFPGLYN